MLVTSYSIIIQKNQAVEIVIETPVVEISEDEIECIENIEKNQSKKLTLLSIDEISNELDASNRTVKKD